MRTRPAAILILLAVGLAVLPAAAEPDAGDDPNTILLKDDLAEGEEDALLRRVLGGLSTDEPVYFIAGGDLSPVSAKFQLSAKYRIFLPEKEDAKTPGWSGHVWRALDDLYAAYTQTSVWDLSSPSAPFRDTTFRPSVSYMKRDVLPPSGVIRRLDVQVGLEHQSNGKSGEDSRSLNIVFARPTFTLGDPDRYHWTVSPKVFAYLDKADNSNIDHYRGYVDLLVKYGKVDELEMTATFRKGTRKAYGSAQLDVTYMLARLAPRLGAFFHVQYFYGYGETLLDYDRNANSQLRAGILIVPYGTRFR